MLIQPASSQLVLVRGTVVSLRISITVRIIEQPKWMEVIAQHFFVPNSLREVGTLTKDPKQGHGKTPQTMHESPCL
ncbi:hypothetical protein TNCV_3439561 [Trichonephila clavipes]|nr:hypothetical protein TNCV_3439561 [Trichonephila clavipes]